MTAIDDQQTGNPFLDGRKVGDVYTDKQGNTCEVIDVFGPELTPTELRRLRRAAIKANATPEAS